MRKVSQWNGGGYLVSVFSVILLGIPALKSALESPTMLACLIAGMATSIIGMAMRWHSHRMEMRDKGGK